MDNLFQMLYTAELSRYWSRIIREEVIKEVNNTKRVKLLSLKTRKFVWNMCRKFCSDVDGTPGVACRLVERFYFYEVEQRNRRQTPGLSIEELNSKLVDEFLLTLMCGISVASKITGRRNDHINNTLVRFYLKTYGMNATTTMVFQKEFDIMKSCDFILPLWTGIDTAIAIGAAVDMQPYYKTIALMMDFVEFYMKSITLQISELTGSSNQVGITQLAAGVVVAVSQNQNMDLELVATTVSDYCAIPVQYVKVIKNVILLRVPMELKTNNA